MVPISRRQLLRASAGACLAGRLWPGTLWADQTSAAAGEADFSFVVLNDLHYFDARGDDFFARLAQQIRGTDPRPERILIAGDLTENATPEQFDAIRTFTKSLDIAAHVVIGNHDHSAAAGAAAFSQAFAQSINYHFEHRGWQFIGLDTCQSTRGGGTRIQPHTMDYAADLAGKLDRARPAVIFTHFPLGFMTPNRPANADELLGLFKNHNLKHIFCGHFHAFTERKFGDCPVTTDRCCSFHRKNHTNDPRKGYFLCRVRSGDLDRKFIDFKPD